MPEGRRRRRAIWVALFAFLTAINLVFAIFYSAFAYRGGINLGATAGGIEYKDFISILLTALGVLMTVLAIFLAVLAVWGFNTLRDEARRVAWEAAEREAKIVAAAVAARTVEAMRAQPASRTGSNDYGKAAGGSDDAHGGT